MDQFPSNSRQPQPPRGEGEQPEEKRVEKVVVGKVVQRKTPLSKRLRNMFIGGNAETVGSYILNDILIPAVRDAVVDSITQFVERMIRGESYDPNRRRPSTRTNGGHGSYVSYNRFGQSPSTPPWNRPRADERRPMATPRARVTHDFGEIILASHAEATQVLDQMYDTLQRYDAVSISDLYEMTGINSTHTDQKWGWVDLRGASVRRLPGGGGYLLDLPAPEPID